MPYRLCLVHSHFVDCIAQFSVLNCWKISDQYEFCNSQHPTVYTHIPQFMSVQDIMRVAAAKAIVDGQ